MERTPFFRRTVWIFLIGLIAVGVPYVLFYLRAGPTNLPGSLLSLVPIFGGSAAIGALFFCLLILTQSQGMQTSLPVLIRTAFVSGWLLAHLVYLSNDTQYFALQLIVLDVDLLVLALAFSLLIAAQFVLPVESGHDRLLAVRRLIGYALGERGPVTFVEEGQARQAYAEDRRPGPGVFLIDSASAVVLRTDTTFTRAMGPGVVFTSPGERCAEALDLRPQIRRLTGSNPAEDPVEGEVTTAAVTQDGISVNADLSVTFMLDPGLEGSPRLGRLADKPPYEFNRPSVERAVYAHTYGELDDVPWTRIPELLVADVWREEVKRWSLSSLLTRDAEGALPLEQIEDQLQKRLIPPLRKDYQGDSVDQAPTSRELAILKARGIRVLDVCITNLQLPEQVKEERSLRWRETWAGEVQSALQQADNRVKQIRERAEQDAELAFLDGFGDSLLEELRSNKRPDRRQTLLALINDVLRPSATSNLEPQLREQLLTMQVELRQLPADCQEEQDR